MTTTTADPPSITMPFGRHKGQPPARFLRVIDFIEVAGPSADDISAAAG